MDDENDVYNYDTGFFFTLLDSKRFQSKFKYVQDQQGLVICPLEVCTQSRNPLNHQDLIDRHLFIPSPYLKNHFVPYSLSQNVYLILDDSKSLNILIFKNGQRTCEYVKLLNIEEGYNDDNKVYKILIVNKELNLTDLNDIDSELMLKNESLSNIRRASTAVELIEKTLLSFNSLNEVSTFGQTIDFMHNTICLVNEYDLINENRINKINKKFIGDEYLNDIELFKKTYIIIYTHLDDCSNNLRKLYEKYVILFFKSYNLELKFKSNFSNSSNLQQVELIILISCEISIIGCLFAKLWPNIIRLNSEEDSIFNKKFNTLKSRLKIEEFSNGKKSNGMLTKFFQINEEYFNLDFKSIVKEINKIALLNNPFERLQCIRLTIDLLSNEMTVLSLKNQQQQVNKTSNFVITSEILIPLLAFILLLSNINCFKSIIYFIDKFNFSSQMNDSGLIENLSNHRSHSLTYLAELNYFMTTFKAAVQFIENSELFL